MFFTDFSPIFLVFLIYSLLGAKQWIRAVVLLSAFQAASPILLFAGGRAVGINPVYTMLPIGFWHVLPHIFNLKSRITTDAKIPSAIWFLAIFTIYSIFASLLFPRLFSSDILIIPPNKGLDTGFKYPLEFGPGNYIQSFYLILNFILVTIVASLIRSTKIHEDDIIKYLKYFLITIAAVGFYQIIGSYFGWFWPESIINSNVGIGQAPEQTFFGIKRMSSTFQEPSMLAMHLVGLLCLFSINESNRLYQFLTLACIAVATSSIGYVGVLLVLLGGILFGVNSRNIKILGGVFWVLIFGLGVWLLDENLFEGKVSQVLILNKLQTGSGISRVDADLNAMQALVQSFGLGVGVGSTRSSSFFTTLAATCGIFGFTFFWIAIIQGAISSFRSRGVSVSPLIACLLGLILGAGLGVPDMTMPLMWILLGICIGLGHKINSQI